MSSTKKYYPEIDISRGIGIILVVLGHALKQTGVMNPVFEAMLSVIYSFHMPLFFVLSGFVAVKILKFTSISERLAYIRDKAARLLVPYFAVGLFYMPVKYVLSSFAVRPYDFSNAWKILIGENPNTVLWFLYTLFWVSVICVIILNNKNFNMVLGISFVVSVVSYILDSPVETTKYLFFFMAGMYIRLNYEKAVQMLKEKKIWIVVLLFVITNVLLYQSQMFGWTFLTAVTGSICTLALSLRIAAKKSRIGDVTEVCGKYSMDIYILSDFIAIAFRILLWGILEMNYIV